MRVEFDEVARDGAGAQDHALAGADLTHQPPIGDDASGLQWTAKCPSDGEVEVDDGGRGFERRSTFA